MKKLLLSVAVLVGLTATAQIPDYGVWPSGVTFTDINGTTYDIDAILDSGKPVVIDAFAEWCGPCWNYHQAGTLEDLYLSVGPSGSNTAMVFGLEADPNEPESTITGGAGSQNGWDWTLGGTVQYPLCNDDNISGIINLGYYPTLILVCPDRTVTEVGQVSQAQWETAINNCGAVPTNTDDPKIVGHETVGSYLCGGATDADVELNAVVQNFTAAAVNGTYTVKFFDGATEIATTDANLNLGAYEYELVTVGTASLPAGTSNLTARITTANDDTNNDELAVSVTNTVAQTINSTLAGLTLDVTFDGYASEFGYVWDAGLPPVGQSLVQIHNDAAAGTTTPIAFTQVGTHADGLTDIADNLATSTDGCYYLMVVDSYGDGLTYPQNGSMSITSANGTNESIAPDYGAGFIAVYDITVEPVGVDEISALTSASIYPNPAKEVANVKLDLANSSNVQVNMVNAMGQMVYNNNLGSVNGTQMVAINTSDVEAGMYFVNIVVDGVTTTQRISVTK